MYTQHQKALQVATVVKVNFTAMDRKFKKINKNPLENCPTLDSPLFVYL